MSIRCPECLTWLPELEQRQPVTTLYRRAHWDDDPVYGCPECGEQFNEADGKLWIEEEVTCE